MSNGTGSSPADVNTSTTNTTNTNSSSSSSASNSSATTSATITITTAVQIVPEPFPPINSNNPDSMNNTSNINTININTSTTIITTNTNTTKPTEQSAQTTAQSQEQSSIMIMSKKRGRGRPKGSKNKKTKPNPSPDPSPAPEVLVDDISTSCTTTTIPTISTTTIPTTAIPTTIPKPTKQKQKRHTFDQRIEQLKAFQQEHGHCNVPKTHDTSLSEWVKNMKYSYANKRLGKKSNMNLSPERISRLESIGNDDGNGTGTGTGTGASCWKWTSTSHDERFNIYCDQLVSFKKEFGHCHVPWNYKKSPGLGNWCNSIRAAYTILHNKKTNDNDNANANAANANGSGSGNAATEKEKEKDKKISLSPARLQRLKEIGFDFSGKNQDEKFEKQCSALLKFKKEKGHCNVPQRYTANPSLGQFCTNMRVAYNCLLVGKKPKHNLSQDRIERLEEIGLKWKVKDYEERFEKHCRALEEFKAKHGHCNVSKNFKEDSTLATWCHQIRFAYHQKNKGKKPGLCVSKIRIERLEAIGFKWFPNRP